MDQPWGHGKINHDFLGGASEQDQEEFKRSYNMV